MNINNAPERAGGIVQKIKPKINNGKSVISKGQKKRTGEAVNYKNQKPVR